MQPMANDRTLAHSIPSGTRVFGMQVRNNGIVLRQPWFY